MQANKKIVWQSLIDIHLIFSWTSSINQSITTIATHPFQNLEKRRVWQSELLSEHLVPRRTVWLRILNIVQPPAAQFWGHSPHFSSDWVTIPLTLELSPFLSLRKKLLTVTSEIFRICLSLFLSLKFDRLHQAQKKVSLLLPGMPCMHRACRRRPRHHHRYSCRFHPQNDLRPKVPDKTHSVLHLTSFFDAEMLIVYSFGGAIWWSCCQCRCHRDVTNIRIAPSDTFQFNLKTASASTSVTPFVKEPGFHKRRCTVCFSEQKYPDSQTASLRLSRIFLL